MFNYRTAAGVTPAQLIELQKDIDNHPEKYARGEWKPSLLDRFLMFIGVEVLSDKQP